MYSCNSYPRRMTLSAQGGKVLSARSQLTSSSPCQLFLFLFPVAKSYAGPVPGRNLLGRYHSHWEPFEAYELLPGPLPYAAIPLRPKLACPTVVLPQTTFRPPDGHSTDPMRHHGFGFEVLLFKSFSGNTVVWGSSCGRLEQRQARSTLGWHPCINLKN